MKASDVIKIGRNRVRAASTAASNRDMPSILGLLGELDDQDSIFRREADEHDEADFDEDVAGRDRGY